ncbi:TlpA family protein disulfide reductase [Pedobacter africanus]|uniref:Glutathione peroxidase, house-cleaning role in reducing lipid peroxides n=1 Tax=Pedobacter africanus TaxID=151894 RepID=A0A1W1YPG8_9SPHI|nr:TlpA disulfide reductase family protein [Pedobacter africanus]SMC38044.1 Glutathione peroxidase, house-cleaning role in reducing lipid peroxides [Pedobacter africanus]
MMTKFYTLALILITGSGINALAQTPATAEKVVFKGKADVKYNGEYVYLFSNQPKMVRDSAKISNGAFRFSRPFTEAGEYAFYSGYEKRTTGDYSVLIIPFEKASEMSIKADMRRFNLSEVKGSSGFFIYDAFAKATDPVYEKLMNDLINKYGKAYLYDMKRDTTAQKYKDMIAEYTTGKAVYNELLKKHLISTVNMYPNSFASVLLMQSYVENLDLPTAEALSKKLAPMVMDNFFGHNLLSQINGRKNSVIGNFIEDFTLNDPQGQPLKFSSLKGRYVLIDFWGSWCGPCHVAFKELRTLYAKYQGKGFEILGLATENSKAAWLKDLEKEKLPWLQVIDEQGNKSVSLEQFAISKYPTTVLVDPTGKIIGRDLNMKALEAILDKL